MGLSVEDSLRNMLEEAWKVGSLELGLEEIRSGATILALAGDTELARMMGAISRELQKIDAQALRNEFLAIVSGSAEDVVTAADGASAA